MGSPKTQNIPKKIQVKYLTKKKTTQSLNARQGHIKHVCVQKFTLENGVDIDWHLKQFGVLCLNQPVSTWYTFLYGGSCRTAGRF